MTTAAGFRSAASTLADAEARLGVILRNLEVGPVGLNGPTLVATTSAIDVAHANVRIGMDQLREQIHEAYRRADICDHYSAAVRRFYRSDDPGRVWPRRAASWVTYG